MSARPPSETNASVPVDQRAVTIPAPLTVSLVRYALGRATYIVGWTVEVVAGVWRDLDPTTQEVIREDVRRALDEGRSGMDMDAERWRFLLNVTALMDAEDGAVTAPSVSEEEQ